jgi:cytochrome P450
MTFLPPGPVLADFAAKYGSTFRALTPDGYVTVTGEPDLIRAVYTADPDSLEPRGVDVTGPIFGSTSLPVSTGARHKRDRKLVAPPFQAGAMRSYGASIAEITRATIATWTPGETFSLLEATQSMALDVIIRVVYGIKEKTQVERTRATVLDLIHALNPVILAFPILRQSLGGYGPWAKLERAGRALEQLLIEQVRERRAAPLEGSNILSVLVRAQDEDGSSMSDQETAEQLRAILFAGHETTATALAALVDLLHHNPSTLDRVRAEIDGLGADAEPDALASLPLLEAACYEALRMYSPVVDVGRIVRSETTLGRYKFPAGEAIVPSPLLLHQRPDLYPEPEAFRPERFLGKKPSPFEFIAFGGGARRCVGAAFALYEMKVIVGTLLREAYLLPLSAKPVEHIRRGITLGPKGKVPVVYLEPRRRPQ